MSLVWFYCTEPSLSISLQGVQGTLSTKPHQTTSNLLHCRDSKVFSSLSHECRVVDCHMSAGCFNHL